MSKNNRSVEIHDYPTADEYLKLCDDQFDMKRIVPRHAPSVQVEMKVRERKIRDALYAPLRVRHRGI